MTALIHVIDDDESFLRSMERRLRGHGYAVATYASVAEFLARPDPEAPGCVLTDLQMPKRDGFDLQEVLAKSPNPLPVVFVTGKGDIPWAARCRGKYSAGAPGSGSLPNACLMTASQTEAALRNTSSAVS